MKNTAIIGGGASGMMSAIAAARKGNKVTIFERNNILGKKILITGNGRCNITNSNVSWQNYHGKHPRFASSVISHFDQNDVINFFEKLGLILIEEDNGRMFPRTQQAQSVVDVLEEELNNLHVNIKLDQRIKIVEREDKGFTLITSKKLQHYCDSLIIATGGKSYPSTGSTGDGVRFVRHFGHSIIEPFPASVPFRIKSVVCNKLQGIKVNVRLKVFHNKKLIANNEDELLFTHLGLSAPVVLKSSRAVSKILMEKPDAKLACQINFFPEYSRDQLLELIEKRIKSHTNRTLAGQFTGMLPKKVTRVILQYSNIDPKLISKDISTRILSNVISSFSSYRLLITGILGWDQAQFTAGGVDVSEIDSRTMESKLVPGLYFGGEIVDIDGESGGYNLQWAWSSGFVAGNNC